jgi:hypothetical protein
MAKIAPDVPRVDIFGGVTPFVIICLCAVFPLAAVPSIGLWLPSLVRGFHSPPPYPSGLAPRAGPSLPPLATTCHLAMCS